MEIEPNRHARERSAGPANDGGRAAALPTTGGLVLVTALLNLYLYAVGTGSAPPLTAGTVVSHAYYLVVIVGALTTTRGQAWFLWVLTSFSSAAFAGVHAEVPTLGLLAAVYAGVSAVTVASMRRLRTTQRAYEHDLEAFDTANRDVQKRLEEQSALFEVSQMTAMTFDLERLFQDAMATIARRLRMYRGTLSLFDPETQQLRVKYAYGLTSEQIARSRYRLGEGISGTVLATGQPMAVPNVGEEPIFLSHDDSESLERETRSVAFLCVPIKMEGKTVGVLSVDRAPVDQRTLGDDLNFLTILASMFAQTLKIQEMIEATVEHERFAVLGRMARSIAHEVRNPLGGIRGAAQLLQMALTADASEGTEPPPADALEEAHDYARIIIQEVDRLNRVVEQLIHFGSERRGPRERERVADLVGHVVFLLTADAESQDVRIVQEVAEDLPLVEVEADGMTQVFLNLARNALEAMPSGGELRFIARASERESLGAREGHAVRYVEIAVCDTGPGIPPELREAVFDPLYTTKQKGTGIGLALSKRLVEEHDGFIEIEANTPHGTRFVVVLPAYDDADGERTAEEEARGHRTHPDL